MKPLQTSAAISFFALAAYAAYYRRYGVAVISLVNVIASVVYHDWDGLRAKTLREWKWPSQTEEYAYVADQLSVAALFAACVCLGLRTDAHRLAVLTVLALITLRSDNLRRGLAYGDPQRTRLHAGIHTAGSPLSRVPSLAEDDLWDE